MRSTAADVMFWLLNANPAISHIKGHAEYNQWGKKLVALGSADGLDPLCELLTAIAADAFLTLEPLRRFESGVAKTIALEVYLRASYVAENSLQEDPYSAFVLSLVAFHGWVISFGDNLYRRPELGTPSYLCWRQIPYVCAKASLRVGALEGAARAIELGYEMLMMAAAKFFWADEPRVDINRYRRLSYQYNDRHDMAIRNLADDLQNSCLPGETTFRAEIGSLFWSLGLIPEANLLKSTANPEYVPSRRQCVRIVRRSLDRIPHDPLVQAVWLEMKDKEPIRLRDHELLFGKINLVYDEYDDFFDSVSIYVEPREIYQKYARTLIAWFRGTLSQEQLKGYLSLCQLLEKMPHIIDLEAILYRLANLGYLLGLQAGVLSLQGTESELWLYRTQASTGFLQRRSIYYPERPDLHSILDLPIFQLVETQFSVHGPLNDAEHTNLKTTVQAIECYRAAALGHWLTVAPPLPNHLHFSQLAPLIERERHLIDALRGAYFMMCYPMLPMYFDYYDLEDGDYWRVHENPETYALRPDNGRRQYREINEELVELWREIEAIDPEYAQKRIVPAIAWSDLLRAIGDHAQPRV